MKIEINLTNKWLYSIIIIYLLLAGGIAAYAYTQSIPNPGHGADTILVTIGGTDKTLQQAINEGDISGRWTVENPATTDWVVCNQCGANEQTIPGSENAKLCALSGMVASMRAVCEVYKVGNVWKIKASGWEAHSVACKATCIE